jgi:Fur family ferric uptake transcriptional regulator
LVARGLASRTDLGSGEVVYATRQHGPHIHLVCRLCGEVTDADQRLAIPLSQALQAHYHFNPDLQHISLLGVCAACQASAA